MNQIDLTQIVVQASSLSERLNSDWFKFDPTQINEQQVEHSLNHWCQVVAQGNWEKFQKRLIWDGLDIDTVRPLLGGIPVTCSEVLPNWAQTLTEVIKTASNFTLEGQTQDASKIANKKFGVPIDPENPLPFEDIMLPSLRVARHKLLTHLGYASLSSIDLPLELLSEKAYLNLERSLLQRLVDLCAKTLEFEFFHFRPVGHSLLVLMSGEMQGSKSKALYNTFVKKLLQDGLLDFFQKYPVLGRLVGTVIDFWVEVIREFLQRLKADLSELQQVFNNPTNNKEQLEKGKATSDAFLGKVIEIKPFLSDPHNQGRSVIALTFESGLKLVYKPKKLNSEVIYNQFLDWCNQRGVSLSLKVLKAINRATYGWVEYVEQQPCENLAEAQRFYKRAGMLLCIMYTLGGTDCIYENLIASGEHPVLIDMEAIMYHEANPAEGSPEATADHDVANQKFWNSVIRSGLLPRWHFNKDNGIAFDVSGLGNVELQQVPWPMPRWKSVNTDDMHLVYEKVTIPLAKNVPVLNGVALSPNDYLDEIIEGFRQMYYFLIEQREALLANGSPLTALKTQWVRFTVRQTRVYALLLERLLAPNFLKDGVERSIELDILSRAFLINQNRPNTWPILQAEIRAMEQLDIPYFGGNTNSDALIYGLEKPIKHYFKQPSYNQVIFRMQNLNETDLAQQVAIIQGAFHAKVARIQRTEEFSFTNSPASRAANSTQIGCLTTGKLLMKAESIAKEIYRTALSATDTSVYWIDLVYNRNAKRFQLQPVSNSLYDGNCGIALFLAALDHVRGSTQFRDLTLSALQSLRNVLQASETEYSQKFARQIGIGGAKGLGSIIYSLVRISQFLSDTALLEDAQQAANLITPELIAADLELHLMAGAAGTILGLLALYHETGNTAVLHKAVICGQHLINHHLSFKSAPKAWKTTLGEQPLTGLSCGAAGIAYALLKLYAVMNDRTYLEAAKEGIAYENSVFSTTYANWPDFRFHDEQNSQPGFSVSWCHGASGIGLARLGGLSILETEEIRHNVEVALQTTQRYSLQNLDTLCYGNFGRIELLLVAAQKLSCSHLRETVLEQAACVIARAEQTGAYQMLHNLPSNVFSPGFFQGTSGIGYEILRLAYPETLPSVLLWE